VHRSARTRAIITRAVVAALAIASPVLAVAQTAAPQAPAPAPPVQAVPGVGSVGAELPGAMMPPQGASDVGPEPAQFTRYGIAAGVGETDNVNLATTNPKSQTMAAANLDFGVKRSGSRLDATASGNFTDLYYLEGAYSNQLLGRFDGLALAKLWPEHLNWMIGDSYGEEQTDPFSAITPLSLQRVNVFQTGPQLTLHPSDATFVSVNAGYSSITYQRSPFDGHDFLGSFEAGREFSALSRVSLVVEAESLRFDNTTLNTNYDRRQAYGHYLIEGARTSIDAQLGATQANDVGSWKTSPLARLMLTRKLSPFSVVTVSGGREYTDSGGSFSNLTANAAGGILIAPSAQTTANYQRDYGSAGWRFVRLRTTIGLTADWEQDTHDLQRIYDARREDVAVDLGRSLTPALFASVTGSVNRYQYINQGFTDKFGTVGAGVAYQAGRWAVIYGRYDHAFRRSSGLANPLFGGTQYDENRVFIMIGYRPHARTDAGGGPSFGGGETP
jgi:hypothetical protein